MRVGLLLFSAIYVILQSVTCTAACSGLHCRRSLAAACLRLRLIAQREGIRLVVTGSIRRERTQYRVDVQTIDPIPGTVLSTESATAESVSDVLGTVMQLGSDVRGNLGIAEVRTAEPNPMVGRCRRQGNRHFLAGMEANSSAGDGSAESSLQRHAFCRFSSIAS